MIISKTLKIIEKQNTLTEFFSIYFSNFFAKFLTLIAIRLNIHPHLITISMIPAAFIGMILLYTNENFIEGMFFASTFYVLLNILDTVDGQVARFKNKISKNGKMLDNMVHFVADAMMIISMFKFILDYFNLNNYFIIISFYFLSVQTIEFYLKSKKNKEIKKISYYFKKKKNLNFLIMFLSLNAFVHLFFLFNIFSYFYKNNLISYYFIHIISFYVVMININKIIKILTSIKGIIDKKNKSAYI